MTGAKTPIRPAPTPATPPPPADSGARREEAGPTPGRRGTGAGRWGRLSRILRCQSWRCGGWGLLALPVALALAWGGGLALFAAGLPVRVEDGASVTDAIVVPTGGSERLPVGLALLEANLARALFVSGVGPAVTLDDLAAEGIHLPAGLRDRVALGHAATDTQGNAQETARWMAERGYHSLRLVTAAYHMPRTLLEFRRAMPGLRVVPHPVFPDAVKHQEWWLWRGTARLIAEEYTKFLVAWGRGLVRPAPGRATPAVPSPSPSPSPSLGAPGAFEAGHSRWPGGPAARLGQVMRRDVGPACGVRSHARCAVCPPFSWRGEGLDPAVLTVP